MNGKIPKMPAERMVTSPFEIKPKCEVRQRPKKTIKPTGVHKKGHNFRPGLARSFSEMGIGIVKQRSVDCDEKWKSGQDGNANDKCAIRSEYFLRRLSIGARLE